MKATRADPSPSAPVGRGGLTIAELEARLEEAEETLDAIRNGEVDAVVIGTEAGQQVYTLENADRPYRVLIEQMREGALTLSGDGTVLYCNERLATIVGTSRESVIGLPFQRFFDPKEIAAFESLLGAAPRAQASSEFNLRSPTGEATPVNLSMIELKVDQDMPKVICGVVTDLTNSRRRSDELEAANNRLASEIEERQRAEESLQLALDAAGMGSWDLDLSRDEARRSLRHDQIFGHASLVPIWGLKQALERIIEDDREKVRLAFQQAETAGLLEVEARIRRADDQGLRWLRIQGRTFYANGNPVRIAGVVADITERMLVEEQLRQAQKMEAVGQLTGGIAHDFNNLLMIIGGSLEMLSRRVALDDKTGRLFDAARQGVARGAKLNQQLLAFSRRQDLRTEVVCVDDLIPDFEHLLDRAVGETVTVKIERAPKIWHCRTDPHQLETAILNLAINARDAMPAGGVLTIATANRIVKDQAAAAWGAAGGDYVELAVGDTGTGMTAEVLARVFEPFFTTKDVGKGTGLGLSQVYGFARQSGGFVTIASEPLRGTTVSIYLPRTDAPATHPSRSEPSGSSIGKGQGQGCVLVVEDDEDVRATTTEMLTELGYSVREAQTGRNALALVEGGETFDLVFTDIIMPDGLSGIELARELRAKRPTLPILFTSGYTAQHVIPDVLADHLRLLRKPYTQTELADAVRAAMGRSG